MARSRFVLALIVWLTTSLSGFPQKAAADQQILDFDLALKQYLEVEKKIGGYIRTPNGRLHYLRIGPRTGQTLIWLHGTYGHAYDFLDFADILAARGYQVIALDYYGHGQTKIPEHPVSIYHLADDLKMLMDHLVIDGAIVGGLSRGGTIATAFYDAYPERVKALILADGGSVSWVTEVQKLSEEEAGQRFGQFEAPVSQAYPTQRQAYDALQFGPDSSKHFRKLNAIQYIDTVGWSFNYNLAQWLWEDNLEHVLDGAFRPTTVPLFEASNTMLNPSIVYRNLDVPMLIIDPVKAGDWLMDFEDENRALRDQHPEWITHLIYEDTYHNMQLDQPEQFRSDILAFLKKVGR
ncbi:alpha/beta fold hydrolase [Flavilitoribacter nigricans]|uniref:Alpha/beta hydrolase n=1 Tax=Flavilitoribacter nigricans (strain ATCC 23147 / DSM 23189 / NBRC 102662 / NCIMB 1420 / SS-2) TaxID=1122177 RepID=A0A2D0N1Y7_FLAN2|nr:alpha/beta hydrolase [Flavilitoribacter nigricans]PHN02408.1 alpha/beta hydrolase [Flavilitoribacter nigricans DSM 23189 = NBRC 102662]